MKRLALTLIAIVLVAATLQLVTIDVPSFNPHEGAVAYTQPKVSASFHSIDSSTAPRVDIPARGSSVVPEIEAVPLKYVAPAPVKKTLWQAILPATLTIGPGFGGGGTIGSGSDCTETSRTADFYDASTYAVITVIEPGGTNTRFESKPVTSTITRTIVVTTCLSSGFHTTWTFDGTATYEVGTYYFTKGWGTYGFTVEVYEVATDGLPAQKLGSSSLAVDASAAR